MILFMAKNETKTKHNKKVTGELHDRFKREEDCELAVSSVKQTREVVARQVCCSKSEKRREREE